MASVRERREKEARVGEIRIVERRVREVQFLHRGIHQLAMVKLHDRPGRDALRPRNYLAVVPAENAGAGSGGDEE